MKVKGIFLLIIGILAMLLFITDLMDAKNIEFPERPIQFIVGYGVGSRTDMCARALAKVAPKYLKIPIVVNNMPGASSTVALNELVKGTPDGYMIALMVNSFRSMTVHMQKVPFNPAMLRTLLGYAQFRQVFFVRGDSPYVKLENLIDYGRKNPGAIKFGHSGRGTSPHIQGLLFFRSANVVATDVPFKGGADFLQAVLGGHILGGVTDISSIIPHISAGTIKPVVAFVDQRLKEYPELPTAKEKGYADVGALSPSIGIYIHRDTPQDRVKKLHDAFKKTIEDPEFINILENVGLKCGYISPQSMEATILNVEKISLPILKELKLIL